MLAQIAANGLFFGSIVALLGLAFSITYMGSRFFSFTFGASYVVAAYAVLALHDSLPFWLSAGVGVLLGGAFGVTLEMLCYGPLRARYGNPMILMLASIGIYTIAANVISLTFGDITRTYRPGLSRTIAIGNVAFTETQAVIMLSSLLLIMVVYFYLKRSLFGRTLRAVSNNLSLAQAVGVDVAAVSLLAIGIGGVLAGCAAILQGLDTDLVPSIGFSALMYGIIASVIAGPRRPIAAAVAGMAVGLISNLAVWRLPSQWQDSVAFLLLGLILYFRPQGLLEKTK